MSPLKVSFGDTNSIVEITPVVLTDGISCCEIMCMLKLRVGSAHEISFAMKKICGTSLTYEIYVLLSGLYKFMLLHTYFCIGECDIYIIT